MRHRLLKAWTPGSLVAGIAIEGGKARLAVVRGGVSFTLELLRELPLADLGKALKPYKDALIVSSLSGTDVLLRKVELDAVKEKEIRAAFEFQSEPLLPFSLDEAILDYAVLEKAKGRSRLSVLATQKQSVEAHVKTLHRAGVEPERISCVPAALASLLQTLMPASGPQGVIWIGASSAVCAIVSDGSVVALRSLSSGLSDELLQLDVDLLRFDSALFPHLHRRLESLRSEIAKTLLALTARLSGTLSVPQVFVVGDFGSLKNLEAYLATALDVPVAELPALASLSSDPQVLRQFAIPLGLSFGYVTQSLPDFRRKEHSYPFPWKKGRRRLMTYLAASLLLGFAILCFGWASSGRASKFLRAEAMQLAELTGQDATELASLPADQVVEKARLLEGRVGSQDSFPYVPDIPKVSDLLSWLSTHPKLVDPAGGDGPLITITSLRYHMTNRPDRRKPKERYSVRVDLEFEAKSPTVAREFHDALLEETDLIAPGTEVKWTVSPRSYKTSFLLNDRTRYL